MKKIYATIIPLTFIFLSACSKDFLKSYERRITGGTWELYDVNSFGIGSGYRPAFSNGHFVFESNGDVTYTNTNGEEYVGSWSIRHDYQDDQQYQRLSISVINFQNQDVISEFFDDMQFTGTDRFKASINSGTRTFTCKFKR